MSDTLSCLDCHTEFVQTQKELFCCDLCRLRFWKRRDLRPNQKVSTDQTLEDMKVFMERTVLQANNIRRNLDRVENDYQDWEDRVNAIEQRLHALEVEIGLEEAEINNQLGIRPKPDINIEAMDSFDITLELDS